MEQLKRLVVFFARWVLGRKYVKLVAQASGFVLAKKSPSVSSRPTVSADKPPVLLMLAIGQQLEEFVMNSLASLKEVEPELEVEVWSDTKTFLANHGFSNVSVRLISTEDEHTSYSEFGTRDFNRVTNLKWTIISQALSEGRRLVLFSDADIVFMRPFLDYLEAMSSHTSVGMQSENLNSFPPEFCTGFMYFTPESMPIVLDLEGFSAANDYDANDQVMLRNWLPQERAQSARIYELNGALFPNGKLARGLMGSTGDAPGFPEAVQPFLFHANWLAGLENKKAVLTQLGLWSH